MRACFMSVVLLVRLIQHRLMRFKTLMRNRPRLLYSIAAQPKEEHPYIIDVAVRNMSGGDPLTLEFESQCSIGNMVRIIETEVVKRARSSVYVSEYVHREFKVALMVLNGPCVSEYPEEACVLDLVFCRCSKNVG
jgi:hypothetical protein